MSHELFRSFARLIFALAVVLFLTAVISPSAGHAAFPGANGKIAFQSDRDGNFEIYVMNADGSGQTRLTNNSVSDVEPAWSSDGRKITFVSDRDGNPENYMMNADGSGQTRLTNNLAVDWTPAWSPDGTKIAFTRGAGFGISQIWVINVNDLSETQLTNDAFLNHAPAWSPDGTKIAFAKAVFGGDAEVYVMNAADGSGQTNLSSNQAFPDQDLDPNWSPDGTQLAFFRGGGGYSEVWKMKADGSGPTRLTNSSASDSNPDWQPLTPCQALEAISDSLQAIIDANPGTPLADKIEDALAKTESARAECAKTPPDNQATVGNIEGAVSDLEAAVKDGLLNPGQGTQLMDQLAVAARAFAVNAIDEAIAQGGDPQKANEAQQALANGDVARQLAQLGQFDKFKEAVNKYKDALGKAESALP